MKTELKEKLEKVVELVSNAMVDPDLEIEYSIPEVEVTSNSVDINKNSYILVEHSSNKYVKRKIKLTEKYLNQTPEEIANLVTFSIEQFKEEIEAEMG